MFPSANLGENGSFFEASRVPHFSRHTPGKPEGNTILDPFFGGRAVGGRRRGRRRRRRGRRRDLETRGKCRAGFCSPKMMFPSVYLGREQHFFEFSENPNFWSCAPRDTEGNMIFGHFLGTRRFWWSPGLSPGPRDPGKMTSRILDPQKC